MKITLHYCSRSKTYKLGDLDNLSTEDLGLILELLGFEVDYSLIPLQFFIKAMESLDMIEYEDYLSVVNDFPSFTKKDKETLKRLIDTNVLLSIPTFSN